MMKQQLPEEGSRGKIINIINIASIGGVVGLMNEPAYCASKGAAVNLTRQLAIDFAPEKINVNAICPGFLHRHGTSVPGGGDECLALQGVTV
jgi:NAD(P)-dependent dehydrogenase (short-subunit alcohol dehydrogenase family)